jgi:repressor LexA
MKKELTQRQEEILNFIQNFLQENGYPPTIRQIGSHFGISSTFGVKGHMDALEKKGYLNKESNTSRGISLVRNFVEEEKVIYSEPPRIPIVGRVAAGSPIMAVENIEGSILLDPAFLNRSKDCFALKVKGDSMLNAGIFEGDLVVVSPTASAVNGEIIVARLHDEVTVKTFENKYNRVRLIPENDKYQPIDVTGKKEFSIVGKVVGVLRWFN